MATKISIEPWHEEVVREFYALEDDFFFRECHKKGGDFEECVRSTVDSISSASEMYCLYVGRERAAFFVKNESEEGCVMEGFHIKRNFRNPQFFELFWQTVRKVMPKKFYLGIYYKNMKAYTHLERNGLKYSRSLVGDDGLFYIFES
jgi:hypothetical protein